MDNNRAVIAGYGYYSLYANNPDELINNLLQGKQISSQFYLDEDTNLKLIQLKSNLPYAPFPNQGKNPRTTSFQYITQILERMVEQTLERAGLAESELQSPNVRVYLACHGMRADIADFVGYIHRSDDEDLFLYPNIKKFHSDNYAQDKLAAYLTERYNLSVPPLSVYSASCSCMSAIHIATHLIEQDEASLCLILNWSEMLLQDLVFFDTQNLIALGDQQPFSMKNDGFLFTNVATGLLLESKKHALARSAKTDLIIQGSSSIQSSGSRSSASFSADFRSIAAIIEESIKKSQLSPADIACIFPHANGSYAVDKAEALAILKIWGAQGIPVVSYKGQIGYSSTASAIIDLIIVAYTLREKQLIAFKTNSELDQSLQLDLHADQPPRALMNNHIVKVSIGMEGSAIAIVVSHSEE